MVKVSNIQSVLSVNINSEPATQRLKELEKHLELLGKTKMALESKQADLAASSKPDDVKQYKEIGKQLTEITTAIKAYSKEYRDLIRLSEDYDTIMSRMGKSSLAAVRSDLNAAKGRFAVVDQTDLDNLKKYYNLVNQLKAQQAMQAVGLTGSAANLPNANFGRMNLEQLRASKEVLNGMLATESSQKGRNAISEAIREINLQIDRASTGFINLSKAMSDLPNMSLERLNSLLGVLKGRVGQATDPKEIQRLNDGVFKVEQQTKLVANGFKSLDDALHQTIDPSTMSIDKMKAAVEIFRKELNATADDTRRSDFRERIMVLEEQIKIASTGARNLDHLLSRLPCGSISEVQAALPILKAKLAQATDPKTVEALRKKIFELERNLKQTAVDTDNIRVRIVLMYYINLDSFLESPDEDLKRMLVECAELPP